MKKLTTIALAALSFAASAQQLQVSTGSPTGTYSSMFKQLSAKCGNTVALIEQNSTGSGENVDRLVGNSVNAAFVQSDVLYLRGCRREARRRDGHRRQHGGIHVT